MDGRKEKLGFAMCGSFCTHHHALEIMKKLSQEYDIYPILSYNAAGENTRFGSCALLKEKITGICGREPVVTLTEAEKFGPYNPLDYMLICPCTGNTAAKLSLGISDTPVTLAAKAHMRQSKPILIALATNDALSGNIESLGRLLQRKGVYLVPMIQDDVNNKPHSLVADFEMCVECLNLAKKGEQARPLFR